MPSTVYLTEAQYKTRFGEAEVQFITQATPEGATDDEMVQAAIDDAAADAESFLVGRYDLDALRATKPAVLVGLIAALARERLHIDRPSQEVTDSADRARTALKQFSDGTRKLVVDDGSAVEATVATGSPAYSRRDEVFTDDNLAGWGGRGYA